MASTSSPQLSIVERSDEAYPEPQTPLGAKLIELSRQAEADGVPQLTIEEIEQWLGRELGGIAAQIRKAQSGEQDADVH